MHHATTRSFTSNVRAALDDAPLQKALARAPLGFSAARARAAAGLPEFEALRDASRDIKNHTLAHLDHYLALWEANAVAAGAIVHWAETAEEACAIVAGICRDVDAKVVTKGKSMISEEIGLNAALEAEGLDVVETDLGEYIIQLRKEMPSHIVAPAIHVSKDQVEAEFRKAHTHLPANRNLSEASQLVSEARDELRRKYQIADVGVTGANFLVAETGSSIICTNEGNGDLTQSLAKVHVAVASIEKIVPTLEDVSTILRVLARSATGQEITSYTTFSTGPKRAEDLDGPEQYHVVVVDNGRSNMLGGDFQPMLRCIRCAACMNHCPVYGAVGGHAYGWVYPGPMGAVLTPSLIGVEEGGNLPNASTFCGRCEDVCPMRIPLPKMMRHWREREFEKHLTPRGVRWGLGLWAAAASRPWAYRLVTGFGARAMKLMSLFTGARFHSLPLAGGWTRHRDFPAPQSDATFVQQWSQGVRAPERPR